MFSYVNYFSLMAVLSKLLATGKVGDGYTRSIARYRVNNRVNLGSSNYYLSDCPIPRLKFNKCSSTRCLTCPLAKPSQIISNSNSNNYVSFCKAFNVIYLIRCNSCSMQYIGQTGIPLHKRINLHRSKIKSFKIG